MSDVTPDDEPQPAPRTVRVPGFLLEEEIGLGDVIKKATTAAGVKPCGPCAKRAAELNRRLRLAPRAG